ncbi:MAG: DUF2155 domain-containing protein [Alphaproteobacteria bacterium]|nr:DUF2155 domain-containing protein [Alphaproteobacteria bacterium]
MLKKVLFLSGLFSFLIMASLQADEIKTDRIVLRALDKVTGRFTTLEADIGTEIKFGNMFVYPEVCYKNPPEEAPENKAFLTVFVRFPNENEKQIFKGWMFSSDPALSAMDNPVYDLWVMDCFETENKAVETSEESISPLGITPLSQESVDEEITPLEEENDSNEQENLVDEEDNEVEIPVEDVEPAEKEEGKGLLNSTSFLKEERGEDKSQVFETTPVSSSENKEETPVFGATPTSNDNQNEQGFLSTTPLSNEEKAAPLSEPVFGQELAPLE